MPKPGSIPSSERRRGGRRAPEAETRPREMSGTPAKISPVLERKNVRLGHLADTGKLGLLHRGQGWLGSHGVSPLAQEVAMIPNAPAKSSTLAASLLIGLAAM